MAYTEKHLDKAGAKALTRAWGGDNAAMVKKGAGKPKAAPAKKPAGGKKSGSK